MDQQASRRLHNVTALIILAALFFGVFFQLNKGGPFRDINPFGSDPYDAVGSFAVQGALLIGGLTYARALRLRLEAGQAAGQAAKSRLIVRGNLLVLGAIFITLLADTLAEVIGGTTSSFWGTVLLAELLGMWLFTIGCSVVFAVVWRRIPRVPPPRDLTPADAIDDLWTLVRVPVLKMKRLLPRDLVDWVQHFDSDWLFARIHIHWLNPRTHPWRFACAVGLLVGLGLVVVQLQEGLPPSLATGLLVAGIFLSGEFVATLAGFALFGGFLGLRPGF